MTDFIIKSSQRHISVVSFINNIFCVLVLFYIVIYPPFILAVYIPDNIRLSIEMGILFYLTAYILVKKRLKIDALLITPLLVIFFILMLTDNHFFSSSAYFLAKLILFILLINALLSSSHLLDSVRKMWVFIACIFAIFSILAFISFITSLASFYPWEFSSGRYFLHHPILGNIVMRHFIGYTEVYSVVGYMMEGVYLGFFYGLNIISANYLIKNTKTRNKFIVLNMLAGVITFSTTFILFFIFYFLAKFINTMKYANAIKYLLIINATFLTMFVLLMTDYFKYTSILDRLQNIFFSLNIILNNSIDMLLFGNGVNFLYDNKKVSIDSGSLRLILEYGIILTFMVTGLFVKYAIHNKYLILFLLFYSLSIPIFNFPFLYILVAIVYCAYSLEELNKSTDMISEPSK
jgi:hypothetical protein